MSNIKSVNTEEIMREIREKIKKREYENDIPGFSEIRASGEKEVFAEVHPFNSKRLATEVYKASVGCEIIYGSNPLPGGIVGFIDRVVRRFVNFLFVPVVEQANSFNYAAANAISELYCYVMNSQDKSITVNKTDISECKGSASNNEELLKTIDILQAKVDSLEKKIEQLEADITTKNQEI